MAFVHRLTHPTAIRLAAIAIAALAVASTSARAATFSYVYAAGATTYTAAPGAAVAVPIYLNEFSTDAFNPSLINSELGLTGAAFKVTKNGLSTIGSVAGNAGLPVLGGFDGPITLGVGTVSEQTSDFNTGAVAQPVVAGGYFRVQLGTVNVTVGANGSTTTFTVGPLAGDATITNATSYDLDDNTGNAAIYDSAAAQNFTVRSVAVPEPTTAGVVTAAALAVARRRRRD